MADPKYRQIADDLSGQITSGELARGVRLPPETDLLARYAASRTTIRDAIKLLIAAGLVETRPGQGTFVTAPPEPFVTVLGPPTGEAGDYTRQPREAWGQRSSAPRVEILVAHGQIAEALRLAEGAANMVSREQEHYIDGLPWSRQVSFYPWSLVERGAIRLIEAGDIEEGIPAYLQATLGITWAASGDTLVVRPPDGREVGLFGLPPDGRVAVIDLSRTAYDPAGEPIYLTVTTYRADRNIFRRSWGSVPD